MSSEWGPFWGTRDGFYFAQEHVQSSDNVSLAGGGGGHFLAANGTEAPTARLALPTCSFFLASQVRLCQPLPPCWQRHSAKRTCPWCLHLQHALPGGTACPAASLLCCVLQANPWIIGIVSLKNLLPLAMGRLLESEFKHRRVTRARAGKGAGRLCHPSKRLPKPPGLSAPSAPCPLQVPAAAGRLAQHPPPQDAVPAVGGRHHGGAAAHRIPPGQGSHELHAGRHLGGNATRPVGGVGQAARHSGTPTPLLGAVAQPASQDPHPGAPWADRVASSPPHCRQPHLAPPFCCVPAGCLCH